MAPTIQAQHVVAVTIPTIAVLFFTYLWYKKRSSGITRSRNDPGGGGGTSRKRTRHRNSSTAASMAAANALTSNSAGNHNVSSTSTEHVEARENPRPDAMKNILHKLARDLETASPIQEICSDSEENRLEETDDSSAPVVRSSPNKSVVSTEELQEESGDYQSCNSDMKKSTVSIHQNIGNGKSCAESDDLNESNDDSEADTVEQEACTKKVFQMSQSGSAAPKEGEGTVGDRKRRSSESDKHTKLRSGGSNTCCTVSRQFDCKNGTKSQEGVGDNLDVAMLKLESLRMSDSKSKRNNNKQAGNNSSKRQNHSAKDSNLISSSSSSNQDANSAASRAKSPNSALSQLASSAPSKARKRKSKKRLKASQNGNHSDEGDRVGNACKSPSSEITSEAAAAAASTTTKTSNEATCDSNNKTTDSCGNRMSMKDTKHTTRKWTSDSEKTYLDSRENDRLSCNLKESHDCDLKVIENHQKDCDTERDSANHSPVDTILDCQSVQFSDAHSEGSSDSGKGCSEGAVSPSPQTPAGGSSISGDQNLIMWYQFVIPQEHVGKLIGKQGQFINTIKARSNTRIFIKKHPTSFKKKICALEGTQPDINKALELIRIRFPEETYPDLTLEEFPLAHQPIVCPLRPELFQLDLVEGVNNDVVISSVVTAGHLFLQQPMHPTYQSLTLLNINMNQVYNSPEAPLVLKPAKDNIVAAPAMGGWYRAQITAVDAESETCDVRFLDYGGYLTLNTTCLRAVRADFLTLPFQAVECFLANIAPINETWCEDAKLVVQGMTYGQILQAQVYDYTPEGIPLILLYVVHGSQVILINDELVVRGFAYPVPPTDGAQSEDYYVYS